MPELISSDRLGALGPVELAAAIRPLFEDSVWLAGKLAGQSFANWQDVIDAAEAVLGQATDADRTEVLRSHPPLGAPSAELKERSETSWREQGAERGPSEAVLLGLSAANSRYESRFGFPFVDWVAGRPMEEMILVIDSRLTSDPSSELARGWRALIDIARDRLEKIEGET